MNQTLLLSNIIFFNLFFLVAIQPLHAEEISPEVYRLQEIELPTTNVKDWQTQQIPVNEIVQVTGVNLQQTETGLEIILDTPAGQYLNRKLLAIAIL
ncbi:MAG: hypothetical protein HC930_18480 [Hydrococcus sp. SU_1_0]|nr:hypothetical protein [Hydrococcus sp. SU_1_0]